MKRKENQEGDLQARVEELEREKERHEIEHLSSERNLFRILKNIARALFDDTFSSSHRWAVARSLTGYFFSWRFFRRRTLLPFGCVSAIAGLVLPVLTVWISYQLLQTTEKQNLLVEEQSKLMDQQNRHIVDQNRLMGAERLSASILLYNEVVGAMDKELLDSRSLSSSTISRLATLSRSLRPYHLNGDTLRDSRPFSPERGWLFENVFNANLNSADLRAVGERTSFERMLLEDASIIGTWSVMRETEPEEPHNVRVRAQHARIINTSFKDVNLYFNSGNAEIVNVEFVESQAQFPEPTAIFSNVKMLRSDFFALSRDMSYSKFKMIGVNWSDFPSHHAKIFPINNVAMDSSVFRNGSVSFENPDCSEIVIRASTFANSHVAANCRTVLEDCFVFNTGFAKVENPLVLPSNRNQLEFILDSCVVLRNDWLHNVEYGISSAAVHLTHDTLSSENNQAALVIERVIRNTRSSYGVSGLEDFSSLLPTEEQAKIEILKDYLLIVTNESK